MNINHLDYGTGPVGPAIDYVFQEKDHNGIVRTDVQVLAGNAAELRRICDAIQHKQKYKSAVISFTPGDNPTRSDLDAVIADFEKVAFSGLEKATYCYLAVLHIEHDGSQHLHIISACIHLATGKAYNPAAPGWEGDYGPMRNYWNWKMGWARPDDPRRARVVYGKNLQKTLKWKQGMDRRQQIAEALSQGVVDGKITSRDDVIADLKTIGSVTRETKSSISLVMAGATSPIRLSGPVFSKNWNAEAVKQAFLVDRIALYFSREKPDPERAERWLALMNERIVLIAEYNKIKFSSIGRGSKRLKYIQKKEYQMDQTLEEFFNSLTGETEAEMPHQVEHLTPDSEPNSTLIGSPQLPDLPEDPVYRSSVLLRLERLGQSTPSTMCSGCRGAVWMTQNGSLQAFCRVMNLITWSGDDPTEIKDCDGASMMARG